MIYEDKYLRKNLREMKQGDRGRGGEGHKGEEGRGGEGSRGGGEGDGVG